MSTFNSMLHRAWDSLFLPFCKPNRIQFSAPWNAARPGC